MAGSLRRTQQLGPWLLQLARCSNSILPASGQLASVCKADSLSLSGCLPSCDFSLRGVSSSSHTFASSPVEQKLEDESPGSTDTWQDAVGIPPSGSQPELTDAMSNGARIMFSQRNVTAWYGVESRSCAACGDTSCGSSMFELQEHQREPALH